MQEVERFTPRSDDGVYETTIIVYQRLIGVGSRRNPGGVAPGLKEARTIEGYACNRGSDGTFEVVSDLLHPGVVLRRVE